MNDDALGAGRRTSRVVTIEDAARYDGDPAGVLALAGGLAYESGLVLQVRAANGRYLDVHRGDVVVLFGPGDLGVMSDGEWARWFGGVTGGTASQ
jgi:hypothetical protein